MSREFISYPFWDKVGSIGHLWNELHWFYLWEWGFLIDYNVFCCFVCGETSLCCKSWKSHWLVAVVWHLNLLCKVLKSSGEIWLSSEVRIVLSTVIVYQEKLLGWDFPGGPVVKIPSFHSRGPGFHPWSGN